jgi:HK97 family phage portal protein
MSFLGRALARMETKNADVSAMIFASLFGGRTAKSGVAVNVDSALRVTTFLACARVISEGIAQLPLKLYKERKDGGRELATDHPLYTKLWRRPNDWQTSFEWRETTCMHAVVAKGGFGYVNRGMGGASGKVLEILPIPPGAIRVRQTPLHEVLYDVSTSDGKTTTVPRNEMMHLRGPSWNTYSGLEMVEQAREALGLAIATEESQSRFHANGTRASGILSTEKTLDPGRKDAIKKSFAEGYAGLQNDYKTIVLDNGFKFDRMSTSPADAQTAQGRMFQVEEICRVLRVFPQMVGYTDKVPTFASAESFFLAHVIHTLGPWVERFEQVISRDILLPEEVDAGYFAKFSVQGLLRGDAKTRAEFFASAVLNGWMTRNEVRQVEDLNPLPGLDEPLMPLNMSTPSAAAAAGVNQKALAKAMAEYLGAPGLEDKIGRVISAQNEGKLQKARDLINEVLVQVDAQKDEE